jgi:5'(3')-deoxyribonucleotidase
MPSDKGELVLESTWTVSALTSMDACERSRPNGSPTYGLKEWGLGDGQYEKLHRFAVTQRQLFETSPVIDGARRVLRKLSDEEYRIRIITHRLFPPFFHETAVRQTIAWLDKNGIPYWDLCFMKEKDQVGADVYIDDAPHNIDALRKQNHYAICFANSTNFGVSNPRANGWDEVYRLIKAQFPKPTVTHEEVILAKSVAG